MTTTKKGTNICEAISRKQLRKANKASRNKDGHTSQTKIGLDEKYLIRNVNMKVHRNQLIVTRADKGKYMNYNLQTKLLPQN